MKLEIETALGVVFRLDGDMVLLPIGDEERVEAFEALTRSLALLAGIKQLDAKANDASQCLKAKEQSACPHRPFEVVHLRLL